MQYKRECVWCARKSALTAEEEARLYDTVPWYDVCDVCRADRPDALGEGVVVAVIGAGGEEYYGRVCVFCGRKCDFDWEQEAHLWATVTWYDVCDVCRVYLAGTGLAGALGEGVAGAYLYEPPAEG